MMQALSCCYCSFLYGCKIEGGIRHILLQEYLPLIATLLKFLAQQFVTPCFPFACLVTY